MGLGNNFFIESADNDTLRFANGMMTQRKARRGGCRAGKGTAGKNGVAPRMYPWRSPAEAQNT